MSNYRLAKTMQRSLTSDEQQTIIKFWKGNQELTEDQVIEHWEKILKMPVTRTALAKAMINYGRKPLSPEAQAARRPLPPDVLMSGMTDRVHRELPGGRPARSVKVCVPRPDPAPEQTCNTCALGMCERIAPEPGCWVKPTSEDT